MTLRISIAAMVLSVTAHASVNAGIIYDNTQTYTGLHNTLLNSGETVSVEHGNQVTLAGIEREVTEIQVFLGVFCCGVTQFDLQLRFYENDGSGGAPGTLIWESVPSMHLLDSGNPNAVPIALFIPVPNIVVPDSFTWTVQVTDRTGNLAPMGPSEFDPPDVGSAPFGYWRATGGSPAWEFVGLAEPPFGAKITAEGPGIPAVSTWGTFILVCAVSIAATVVFARRCEYSIE